jgi:hypothetical protein
VRFENQESGTSLPAGGRESGARRKNPVGHTKIAGIDNLFPCGEKIN